MASEYRSAPEVEEVARDLIQDYHPHLAPVRIEYVFIGKTPKKRGKLIWGRAKKISGMSAWLSGPRDNFDPNEMREPDDYFVLEIALPVWLRLDDKARRALVDHELNHFDLDENDKLTLRPHDLEEFTAIVRRHGLWRPDVQFFVEAGAKQSKLPFDTARAEAARA